jgi:hypothetical protein
MQETQSNLVIINDQWYKARLLTAPDLLSSFAATPPKAYAELGDRAFLGTDGTDSDDSGMIWVTTGSMAAVSNRSYRLGIKKPAETPTLDGRDKEGHNDSSTHGVYMNTTTRRRLAIEFTPIVNQKFKGMTIYVENPHGFQHFSGNWQLRVYTDNAGEPSTTLVDDLAVSSWRPVNRFAVGSYGAKNFSINTTIELDAGTTYWFVFVGDDAYYDNFNDVPVEFYGEMGVEGVAPGHDYDPLLVYNNGSGTWGAEPNGREAEFLVGLMTADGTVSYDYAYTYYNSTHQSESRPSNSQRITPEADGAIFISGYTTPTDPQVDTIRIYRRELATIEDAEAAITDTWKHVVDLNVGEAYLDGKATTELGGELQTDDHFCLDDVEEDDTIDHIRTYEMIPTASCMWKGRLWVAVEERNHLSYSKVFEQDGPTGMIGMSSPDYFPLDNTLILPEPAFPISLYPVSNDLLIVHMSNDTAYSIYGGDQSLNPPADFTIRPLIHSNAALGIFCGTLWSHNHVYLSKAGLFRTSGIVTTLPDYLSEENQSIYDAISKTNLDDTVLLPVGSEIWSLIDFDDDGVLDTILILDMQRDVPTREISDRAFKMYQYDVALNDIDVVSGGDDLQRVYALDAENGYILKLGEGTLDHQTAITAYLETHDISAPNQAMIYQIDLDGWYPDESAVATYTWLLRDHAGNTQSGTMAPTGNEDVRGHRSGTRLKGAVTVRAKVTQVSTKADRLRGLVISHTGE